MKTCVPLIKDFLTNKKSGLIFTYGLTNSGKTYTIVGDPADPGILPLSLLHIVQSISQLNNNIPAPILLCSYLEIYNDDVYDLLAYNDVKGQHNHKKKVQVKEKNKTFYVPSK